MKHGKRDAKTEAQKQIDKARRDSLRAEFLTQWRRLGGPELEEEYHFHLVRGWSFDFADSSKLIAIEVEGGTWLKGGGRHNRPKGYSDDCQKYNQAILDGWRLFRFTADMIANDPAGHLLPVVELMRQANV